jgi:DNA-binding IclR family transcriptional regulator
MHLSAAVTSAYREMPGLTLTLSQAARLFGLRDTTCRLVLDDLVSAGTLRRLPDGQYGRA